LKLFHSYAFKECTYSPNKFLFGYLLLIEISGGGVGCSPAARMDELHVVLILMTDTECERDNILGNSLVYGAYSGVNMCKMGFH
jgi:hypothetical protein